MNQCRKLLANSFLALLLPAAACGQATRLELASTDGLRLHNVAAQRITFKGHPAVRLTVSPEITRRPEYIAGQLEPEAFAWITGPPFSNGVIEAEIAGTPVAGAYPGARGFVGIAFRLQPDQSPNQPQAYDAFYLRPTNGRAEDQERRNRAVQYISHPEWTWQRLRRETPAKYESYVDLVPDTWTKIRIEVRGAQAKLYVHDLPQPVLIVNDLKSGSTASGAVALWIGPGTVAHFRNLLVRPW
jgi:hypothetical protein